LYKFDEYLSKKKLSPSKALGFTKPYQLIVINEIKAQFHYLCGLFIIKTERLALSSKSNSTKDLTHLVNIKPIQAQSDNDMESLGSVENYDRISNTMLSYICLANSSICSKPNNKENFQVSRFLRELSKPFFFRNFEPFETVSQLISFI